MKDSQIPLWQKQCTVAAFSTESAIRILDPASSKASSPFGSSVAKKLVRLRWAFTLDVAGLADEEAKFAGAVLAKIAQRGFPAPCSLDLERYLLNNARQAGLLRYVEAEKSGALVFEIVDHVQNLPDLLKATFFTELLIGDEDVKKLLNSYRSVMTPAESDFFDIFLEACPDPRISLFLIPKRMVNTMVRLASPTKVEKTLRGGQTVDFAVQVPDTSKNKWLRIVVEIEEKSIDEEYQEKLMVLNSDTLSANRWEIWRLTIKEKNLWRERARELVQNICDAIGEDVLKAASHIRCNLSPQQRQTLMDLVLLPIAEAQLLLLIARWLHAKGSANIRIHNPQMLNLKPVLQNIDGYLSYLQNLYGLRNFSKPVLVDRMSDADVVYLLLPSSLPWNDSIYLDQKLVVPSLAFDEYVDPIMKDSLPRQIPSGIEHKQLEASLTFFLRNLFRKTKFREGQMAIIHRALRHEPVVGLLPTAAGKSLCYQLVSLLQPGFVLVVQPLRSLMLDQQDNLDAMGVHRSTTIMSHGEVSPEEELRTKEEGYKAIKMGLYFFVFISPERFQIPDFRQQLNQFVKNYPIPYCVVDEAHCVSEWGHDFRPSYLNLGRLVSTLCKHHECVPTLIALTGTASQNVLTDILRELGIPDPDAIVKPDSFDRRELNFEVIKVSSQERENRLISILQELINRRDYQSSNNLPSGLIFTYFIENKQVGTVHLKNLLLRTLPELSGKIEMYSGEPPKDFDGSTRDWEIRKTKLQQAFKRNEIPILVCTHSFGMGIDKPDIRFTIHAMLPRSLEEFYQQAGRAGRDGLRSHCFVIFVDDIPELANKLLDPLRVPIEKIGEILKREPTLEQQSDAVRNTWSLRNSFLGKNTDKAIVSALWDHLSGHLPERVGDRTKVNVPFNFLQTVTIKLTRTSKLSQLSLEKAIYRLLAVGAIEDYEKDYGGRVFIVHMKRLTVQDLHDRFKKYLSRYTTEGETNRYLPELQPEENYVEAVKVYAHRMVDFVYDHIERRRRRATWEMLQAVRNPTKFREQLMAYLQESEYTQPVKEITRRIDVNEWFQTIDRAQGVDGLVKLLGACRRFLEELPEHPGLLLITGFCRLHYGNEGLRDIGGAFKILREDYPKIDRCKVAELLLERVRTRFPGSVDSLLMTILEHDSSLEMARLCYSEATPYSDAYNNALFVLVEGISRVLSKVRDLDPEVRPSLF